MGEVFCGVVELGVAERAGDDVGADAVGVFCRCTPVVHFGW